MSEIDENINGVMGEQLNNGEVREILKNTTDLSQNTLQIEKEFEDVETSSQLQEKMHISDELEQLKLSILHKTQELIDAAKISNEESFDCQGVNGDILLKEAMPMQTENSDTEFVEDNEQDFLEGPIIELARVLWKSNAEVQHFTKGCIWSPDGSCLLVPVHLDGMHMYELPAEFYSAETVNVNRPLTNWTPAFRVAEGGTIYDICWYPFMNSQNAESCCWLATRQHEPIHLWDAFDGRLRCSYRGYNAVDEVESAISVIFSLDVRQIFGGYKKDIKVFDTSVPGRKFTSFSVKQAVSCFAQSDLLSITAGSWKGFVNHYDLRVPKTPQLVLGGHSGGITWLRYAETDTTMLFSGARKDNSLLQWDMRNTMAPVREFQRNVDTNQRIYFDLSPQDNWLLSGDTKGMVHVWNLLDESESYELPIHKDCCNGVSVNPRRPLLATSSGQYHFTEAMDTEIVEYENALCLLWRGKTNEN